MADDEHGVEDNFQRSCAVCETELTEAEIQSSRESGGPFLCSVHADQETPVAVDEVSPADAADQPED